MILSVFRNFSSLRRAISSSEEYYVDSDRGHSAYGRYVKKSNLHYKWDEELEIRYSTTQQRIRGTFSQILNDNDETNDGNNDFQHKGILRTSSEKHGKWMKIRHMPPDLELIVAGETIHKSGTNFSKFVDDMQLVIDVNQTILVTPEGKKKKRKNDEDKSSHLCHLLQVMTNRKSLDTIPEQGIPPVLLNVTADCNILNTTIDGQGNTILALYGLRMITALAKVDFAFQCKRSHFDGLSNSGNTNDYKTQKARKLRWVFPWFASFQPATDSTDPWPYMGNSPTQDQLCSSSDIDLGNKIMPIEKMADQIRNDVRVMALQLIGSQTSDPKRTHPLIPLDVEPWIPNITPDDVVIHFPCYDDSNDWKTEKIRRNRVGMMRFKEYTKHILKNTKSIGVILEHSRELSEDVCYRAGILLVEYLQSFYTKHPISISLYEDDTLPLQYARMAVAQQSFSSFSTFGMIPIIGTFGKGYFQPSDTHSEISSAGKSRNQNSIIRNIVSKKYKGFENIKLMEGKVLSSKKIDSMSFDDISKWLLKSS